MSNIIDSIGANPTVNNNVVSTAQTAQSTSGSTNFADALDEALRWQMQQSNMTNTSGQSGLGGGNSQSGLGELGGNNLSSELVGFGGNNLSSELSGFGGNNLSSELSGFGGNNLSSELSGFVGNNLSGGLGGIAGLGGSGALSGPGAMLGVNMPSATAGLENALIATAENGEMSGAHLMLFMMIMMMQTSDSGGDFAPIMQMLAQLLTTQVNGQAANPQLNNMWTEDTEPDIKQMVDIALSQVGYQEQNRDGSFGNGNFTQFGAWYGMDGQPWCAMFVSWAADQVGALNDIVPRHASTSQGVAAYQSRGLYAPQGSGYLPREGDAIYFRNSAGQVNHVGIVVAFDPSEQRVFTVEGNTNNGVHIRHYDLSNPRIHGFGLNGGTSFGSIPASSTSGDDASVV